MGKNLDLFRKVKIIYAILILIMVCTETACSKQQMHLAINGKSNAVIVIPSQPSLAEKQAANRLKYYLEKITSGVFQIKSENEVGDLKGMHSIQVGQTTSALRVLGADALKNAGEDEIFIKTSGNSLILAGEGQRGTLYSVYHFLENYLGCKWWSPSEQTIPSISNMSLDPIDYSYKPIFNYRSHYIYNALKDAEYAVSLHENGDNLPLIEEWGGQKKILGWVHTFSTILPPSKYFQSHPEWYSDPFNDNLPSTKRSNLPEPQSTQLCMSNELMQKEFLKNTLKWISENPSYSIISVSQNDNKEYCHCSRCTDIIKEEGSASGLLLRFVNRIAKVVAEQYPDKSIETLAYYFSEKPPLITKPASNVIIRFAPIDADFARAIDDPANQTIRDNIQHWARISKRNFFWGYNTNVNLSLMPHPSLYHFQEDLRFLSKNNFEGIFVQDNTNPEGYGYFTTLQAWIVGKLMWNPELNYSDLLTEFMSGYYGEAGEEMKSYFLMMQKALIERNSSMNTFNTNFDFISDEVLEEGKLLFDLAQQKAKHNQILADRIKKEKISFDYTHLYMDGSLNKISRTENTPQNYEKRFNTFFTGLDNTPIADPQVDYAIKGYRLRLKEELKKAKMDSQRTAGSPKVITVQQDQFDYVNFGELSSIVSDPSASDQSAARIDGKTGEWVARVLVEKLNLVAHQGKWEVSAYLKATLFKHKAINEKSIISFGVFNTESKEYIQIKDVSIGNLIHSDYKKITLKNISLNNKCVIWFAVSAKSGEVQQLLVDKVELVKQ